MKRLIEYAIKAFNNIPDCKLRHHLVGELLMSIFLVIFMLIFKTIICCSSDKCPWFWLSIIFSSLILIWIAWYKEYVYIPSINLKPSKNNFYSVLKGGLSVIFVSVLVFLNCQI